MIRSTKVRWLTYKEDMNYWQLWDEKEEFMDRHSRSRAREADRNRALGRGGNYRSRSRSRGRSIGRDNMNDIPRDGSCDRYGRYEDERKNKEQVKFVNGYIGFSFLIHLYAERVCYLAKTNFFSVYILFLLFLR